MKPQTTQYTYQTTMHLALSEALKGGFIMTIYIYYIYIYIYNNIDLITHKLVPIIMLTNMRYTISQTFNS